MNARRLREIRALRDAYGDSTDQRWTPAFVALDDLLAELDSREDVLAAQVIARFVEVRDQPCPLSDEELAVLVAAANGITCETHARAVYASVDTVKGRRARAQRALGARSTAHAVALCMAHNWITPMHIETLRRPT